MSRLPYFYHEWFEAFNLIHYIAVGTLVYYVAVVHVQMNQAKYFWNPDWALVIEIGSS